MFKTEHIIKSINRNISIIKEYIRFSNTQGFVDANRIVQLLIAGLLNEIRGLELVDLDSITYNHPGIDLGDVNSGMGVQVSSKIDSRKINHTVSKILEYEIYKNYPNLMFFNTAENQKSYKIKPFDTGKVNFHSETGIVDWNILLKEISQIENVQKLERINKILEDNIDLKGDLKDTVDESDGIHLLFKDEKSFNKWNDKVSFNLGLPKISFNENTGLPNYNQLINKYSSCVKSNIPGDKRVSAKANKEVSRKFLNEVAQNTYNFKISDYHELEETGIYRDFDLKIDFYNEIELPNINDAPPSIFKLNLDLKYIYSSLSHSFEITLKNIRRGRKSYYFDSGETLERNRLSFYLSEDGNLCFRMVDSNSKVYLFEINFKSSQQLFERNLHLEFRIGAPNEFFKFSLLINGILVYFKAIDSIWKYIFRPQNNKTFANILGNYNGEGWIRKHSVDILYLSINHSRKEEKLQIINQYYYDHNFKEDTFLTKDKKLVSMGSKRKSNWTVLLPWININR